MAARNRRILLACFLTLAVTAGCRSRLIPYVSERELTSNEAQRIVTEVVERQHPSLAPLVVEVTRDKLAVTMRNQTRTAIYFGDMTTPKIYKYRHGRRYVVMIRDPVSRSLIRVWTPDLSRAQQLVDGLSALQRQAIAVASDPSRRAAEERLEKLREIREDMEGIRRQQAEEQRKRLEMEVEKSPDQEAE